MVSVVIPAFNAGRFIKRTIESVLSQTYRDFEIIVVDDGSTDNTAEVVRSYGPKVRYIYQENAGDGPSRNTGISAAKGDWIAFLDHDDEWLPEKLEFQMALLEENPGLRWCGTNYYKSYFERREHAGNTEALKKILGGGDYFENFFTAVGKKGCSLVTTTMVVHKTAFERAGLFDFCWLLCADLDMWWRIAYHFPRIGYLARPLAIMHLDVLDIVGIRRHMVGKRGEDTRNLVARHMKLAKEQGCLREFKPLARRVLRESIITTIYHGFKGDARITVRQFSSFVPWYWRFASYLLTIFPKTTSVCVKFAANLAHKLRLQRQVTRSQIYSRKVDKTDMSD